MAKRIVVVSLMCVGIFSGARVWKAAQQPKPDTVFRVDVNMVQLDVAVTDKKGAYVSGLSPWDFEIYEDGIPQKLATFGEQNEAPRRLEDYPRPGSPPPAAASATAAAADPPTKTAPEQPAGTVKPMIQEEPPDQMASMVEGASVFTPLRHQQLHVSRICVRPGCHCAIRPLARPSIPGSFDSDSRNFSRICTLTPDRSMALGRVRETVAGQITRPHDALLMTLKDVAQFFREKMISSLFPMDLTMQAWWRRKTFASWPKRWACPST